MSFLEHLAKMSWGRGLANSHLTHSFPTHFFATLLACQDYREDKKQNEEIFPPSTMLSLSPL